MQRAIHTTVPAAIGAIGYALLIGLGGNSITGHYIAVTVATCGASAALPPLTSWFMVNFAGRKKRTSAIAIITAIGSVGGIVSGQIYRASDGPRYIHGHIVSLVLMLVTAILAFITRIILSRINHQRDKLTIDERHAILSCTAASELGDLVTNYYKNNLDIYTKQEQL